MLKSVRNLVNGAKVCGNHSKAIVGNTVRYMYHGNCICKVDTANRTVHYDYCGWHTVSTTRAINSYKEIYGSYTEI